MLNAKFQGDKNDLIVKKVNVPETLRNIPHGVTVHFTRKELTNRDTTVMSAISRLNTDLGSKEFEAEIDDKDGSYFITRH